jgi:hypothetical protein
MAAHASGAVLPAGTDVSIDFFSLHRDPSVFPDPEVRVSGGLPAPLPPRSRSRHGAVRGVYAKRRRASQRFDPERFSEAQAADRSPYAYMPFGGGPRRCVGEVYAMNEGLLVLAALVRNYRWQADPARPPHLEFALTLRAAHGLWCAAAMVLVACARAALTADSEGVRPTGSRCCPERDAMAVRRCTHHRKKAWHVRALQLDGASSGPAAAAAAAVISMT